MEFLKVCELPLVGLGVAFLHPPSNITIATSKGSVGFIEAFVISLHQYSRMHVE